MKTISVIVFFNRLPVLHDYLSVFFADVLHFCLVSSPFDDHSFVPHKYATGPMRICPTIDDQRP